MKLGLRVVRDPDAIQRALDENQDLRGRRSRATWLSLGCLLQGGFAVSGTCRAGKHSLPTPSSTAILPLP